MTSPPITDPDSTVKLPLLYRAIGFIERIGNLLPHPFWLFWIMAVLLGVVSWVLSVTGVSVTLPESGDVVEVKNLLSTDGLKYAIDSALDNFASFPPLAVVLVVLLGVSVAEKNPSWMSAPVSVLTRRIVARGAGSGSAARLKRILRLEEPLPRSR